MTAAKKTAAPVIPLLTKPAGASKSSKATKPMLTGFEATAQRLREINQQLDTLTAEKKMAAEEVTSAASALRRECEANGQFSKTVEVATGEDKPIAVVFSDRYSPVAVEHEPALRTALGHSYDSMFRRECKVSARGDLNLDALKACLGDKFDAFCGMFDVTEFLTPVDGFMETRANLRRSMSTDLNTVVDGVIDQVQFTPSVRTK